MKPEFVITRGDKQFVLYAGLLGAAHEDGLESIRTTLVQKPASENGYVAIVEAEVKTKRGIFCGIGDASPDNVGRMVAQHYIRMAETRAKARALRDALNIGATALEELGEAQDGDDHDEREATRENVRRFNDDGYGRDEDRRPAPRRPQEHTQAPSRPNAAGQPVASEAQIKAIFAIAINECGMDKEGLLADIEDFFGCKPDGLTKAQASRYISYLKGDLDSPKADAAGADGQPAARQDATTKPTPGEPEKGKPAILKKYNVLAERAQDLALPRVLFADNGKETAQEIYDAGIELKARCDAWEQYLAATDRADKAGVPYTLAPANWLDPGGDVKALKEHTAAILSDLARVPETPGNDDFEVDAPVPF